METEAVADSLTAIDRRFADLIAHLAGDCGRKLWLGAALASHAVQKGHVCLDLKRPEALFPEESIGAEAFPSFEGWRDALESSPAVGAPGEYKPLILDDRGRLYLCRYWTYETVLVDFFRTRAGAEETDPERLAEGLGRLFPGGGSGPDDQKRAALTAVRRPLAVITGGPGTGKTTTVVKILALLLEQACGTKYRIALSAPTGKAAARLSESVRKAKQTLECRPEILALVPEEASTLHRLLGAVPHSPRFRHDAGNPLPYDALVVDEASMIDLPLMAKLVQALPEDCRLILLGDRDQLASVQPGFVFGDICGPGANAGDGGASDDPGLQNSIVTLEKSYRFGAGSGIGTVSRLVNSGDARGALEALDGGFPDVSRRDLPAPGGLEGALEKVVLEGYGPYLRAGGPEAVFEAFGRFRILCAVRRGPYGVMAVNRAVMNILGRAGLVRISDRWFSGQPVLVTTNDYRLRLFNGDIGIVLADPDEPAGAPSRQVFFPAEAGGFRKILPMRLPEHETVYGMTVHKSQGSEFDRVLLILPQVRPAVLTRELIYTGITRAIGGVEIWSGRPVFEEAVATRIERTSGLRASLWVE